MQDDLCNFGYRGQRHLYYVSWKDRRSDVRGKGSQFEAAFNFIRHYAIPDDGKDKTHVVCTDSDLKG